jgi:hypothetical protein
LERGDGHTFLLLLDTAGLGLGCRFGAGLGHGFGGGFRFGVSRCLGSFWWHLEWMAKAISKMQGEGGCKGGGSGEVGMWVGW